MKTATVYCLQPFLNFVFSPYLPTLSLLPFFFGWECWKCHHATSNVLLCLMALWTETCRALVTLYIPEGPCCVFHAKTHQIYRKSDKDDMLFARNMVRQHTHRQTYRKHMDQQTDTHINIREQVFKSGLSQNFWKLGIQKL